MEDFYHAGGMKVVLKELQKDPAKGKFLHADFLRVSRKTKLKVIIPINFLNEEECAGVKNEGGVLNKTIREVEVMCLAGNIPESIDIDVTALDLGQSVRLTEINLPDGAEIPGLTEETDQMVISVNAPKAVSASKKLVRDLSTKIDQKTIKFTVEALADVWENPEAIEGINAFFEKRKPNWLKEK